MILWKFTLKFICNTEIIVHCYRSLSNPYVVWPGGASVSKTLTYSAVFWYLFLSKSRIVGRPLQTFRGPVTRQRKGVTFIKLSWLVLSDLSYCSIQTKNQNIFREKVRQTKRNFLPDLALPWKRKIALIFLSRKACFHTIIEVKKKLLASRIFS